MTDSPPNRTTAWQDAVLAAALLAVNPPAFGGVTVKAASGPVRERWLALVREFMPTGVPVRKVPLGVSPGRLLGGLDLASTIQTGRPVLERGLLAEANGGLLIVPSAERLESVTSALISAVLDDGFVAVQRDGFAMTLPARFGVIALDESRAEGEAVRAALSDRLAIRIDLDGIRHSDAETPANLSAKISAAREVFASVQILDDHIEALCAAAVALGAGSVRTPCQAASVARLAAALDGRHTTAPEDLAIAVRLVLAPRATRLPVLENDDKDPPEPEGNPDPPDNQTENEPPSDQQVDAEKLKDMVMEAAQAAIPAGLLELLKAGSRQRRKATMGRSGVQQKAVARGRPTGSKRGDPRTGARIDLLETLRVAAPWQKLRKKQRPHVLRLDLRRDDLRVKRFKNKTETTTVFVVDASGSSALHRLAEAKGAIELMLADCYVRRDSVAMISFRGKYAEMLLAPTRSLARAKRNLAALPGGGGTPLAAAIEAAAELGQGLRRKGQTPSIVFLTDGRANVGRDGKAGRTQAMNEAVAAAKALRFANLSSIVIDTSPQPKPEARQLAEEMGATYLPLPHADAAAVNEVVRLNMRSAR